MTSIPLPIRLLALAVVLAVSGCQGNPQSPQNPEVVAMAKAGKAYYDEKCKTEAGEKIYRTVADVEGVLLMKVRPARTETELQDPNWPGAAFSRESTGDWYIRDFLGYEQSSRLGLRVTPDYRGYITNDKRPESLPGYRYVDVIDAKDGQRVRVIGTFKEVTHTKTISLGGDGSKFNAIDYVLEKTPTTSPAPRYAVTYEDHVLPQERAMGVASSTVKVIDLSTNEVLGEMIRYAYRPQGLLLTEWLTANRCPDQAVGVNSATRKFVDQVLIPKAD